MEGSKVFLIEPKHQFIYHNEENKLGVPINKRNEIVMWILFYPNWNANFNSKNDRKRSFSYETKASISFLPIRRMCLWDLMTKRKVINMWILVYHNWMTNFKSKTGRKKSFPYETTASISFIPMRRICLWCPIMKREEIIT